MYILIYYVVPFLIYQFNYISIFPLWQTKSNNDNPVLNISIVRKLRISCHLRNESYLDYQISQQQKFLYFSHSKTSFLNSFYCLSSVSCYILVCKYLLLLICHFSFVLYFSFFAGLNKDFRTLRKIYQFSLILSLVRQSTFQLV